MKKMGRKSKSFLILAFFVWMVIGAVGWLGMPQSSAQSNPSPPRPPVVQMSPITKDPAKNPPAAPTAPAQTGLKLSDYMQQLTLYAIETRKAFIQGVESDLGGYFFTISYWLAWALALGFIIRTSLVGGWDGGSLSKYVVWLAFCLLLLGWCGDVDGDGVRGDIINRLMAAGNSFAYGHQGNDAAGSYLGRLVEKQQQDFDANYQKFVENKMMVRVNGTDMPVKYPGSEGFAILAALYTGKATENSAEMNTAKSREWQMGMSFEFLNIGRAAIVGIDFFLLMLQGFLVITLRLAAPFMVAVAVDRALANKISLNFLWGTIVVTLIFPVFTQIARYCAYYAGNIGLGINPTTPYFTFDPTTGAIVANGEPVYIIIVAGILMIFGCFIMLFSLGASYKLMQGAIVEAISSTVSSAFTTLSSIGMSAGVGAWASRLSMEATRQQIETQYQTTAVGAQYDKAIGEYSAQRTLETNNLSAQVAHDARMTSVLATRQGGEIATQGTLTAGMQGLEADRQNTINGVWANWRHSMKTANAEERKASAENFVEMMRGNNDATSKYLGEVVSQEPGKLDLLAEQYENYLKGIPVAGSVAGALGINKDALNNWFRGGGTSLGKMAIQNALGTAVENNNSIGGFNMNAPNSLIYQRPDGSLFNAMNNQVIATNAARIPNLSNGVPLFDQGDTRWGGDQLGAGKTTIGGAGCAMTSMAMAGSKISGQVLTPKQLDGYLDSHGGYSGKGGNSIEWNTAAQAFGLKAGKAGWSMNTINQQLDAGRPVVVGVDYKQGSRGGANGTDHWVTLTGRGQQNGQSVYYANDPATGKAFVFGSNGQGGLSAISGAAQNYHTTGQLVVFSGGGAVSRGNFGSAPQTLISGTSGGAMYSGGNQPRVVNGANTILQAQQSTDLNRALTAIRQVDAPTANVLSKRIASDMQYEQAIRNNQVSFEGRNAANQNYYIERRAADTASANEQTQLANMYAQNRAVGLQTSYQASMSQIATVYEGERSSAAQTLSGAKEVNQMNFQTQMNNVQQTHEKTMKIAEMVKTSSLEVAQKQAVAGMISQIGQSVVHHVAEAPERLMRF
jgi:hypothetical protein